MPMTYPHTTFTWYDQSQITQLTETDVSRPNYLLAFSADKGTEQLVRCTYENFHKYYGNYIDFSKHGQPLLQAAAACDNGGIVYCKRVVADDATLANVCVFLEVTQGEEEQKTDKKGNLLFTQDDTGAQVTASQKAAILAAYQEEHGNLDDAPAFTAIMIRPAILKYTSSSYENCKTMDDVIEKAEQEATETKLPMFIIADIGRGLSKKSFSITPDYQASKTRGYIRYQLNTIENSKITESIGVCLNHNILENRINRSLYTACKQDSYNLQAYNFYDNYDKAMGKVMEYSGNTKSYCNNNDLLYGLTYLKAPLDGIKIDPEGVNLSSLYGVQLENGSNGAFGDSPFGTEEYERQVTAFFSGEIDDNIYDLDNYKFDLFMDANYPTTTKRAIESLALFREDNLCMMDCGIEGFKSMDEIEISNEGVTKSKFVMNYPIYYDIIDPYSGKQITVTAMYDMTKLMIPHFLNNVRYKPMAGELNGFVIDDVIEGTENFIPKNLPSGNQKEILGELRINHLGKYNGTLVFESLWTTQEEYSQLTFGNNVLAIQEVIKAVRDFCPANRFSMMYGNDLQDYQEDINEILSNYTNGFEMIGFKYLGDESLETNKIYGAAISFICKDFNIAEDFKIYVL